MPRKKPAKGKPAKRKPAEDTRSTQERMKQFLQAYVETCNIMCAARLAKINPCTHYEWLRTSPKYKAAFEKYREKAGWYIEASAIDRAVEGWLEPVYYQGSQCGSVRRYDGGLTQFLLRGLMPEKYGQKTEITGPAGTPMQAEIKVTFVRPGDASFNHE